MHTFGQSSSLRGSIAGKYHSTFLPDDVYVHDGHLYKFISFVFHDMAEFCAKMGVYVTRPFIKLVMKRCCLFVEPPGGRRSMRRLLRTLHTRWRYWAATAASVVDVVSFCHTLSCLVLSYVLANTPMESNGEG